MTRTQVCCHCRLEFSYEYKRQRPRQYCGPKCRKEAEKAVLRAASAQRRSAMPLRVAKPQLPPNRTKNCPICGETFSYNASEPTHRLRVCSAACRATHKRRTRKPSRKVIECRYCGKSHHPTEAKYNQFCSRECGWKHKSDQTVIFEARREAERQAKRAVANSRACETCGSIYRSWQRAVVLCVECRDRKALEKLRAAHSGERTCRVCSNVFSVEYGDKSIFCSSICRDAARRAAKKRLRQHGCRGSDKHRKRARFFGVNYQPISLSRVLNRDGWKCGICGGQISRAATYPDAMMASLDHIVPMSKGGAHTYANIQAAHHRCNTLKGDKMTGQATWAKWLSDNPEFRHLESRS